MKLLIKLLSFLMIFSFFILKVEAIEDKNSITENIYNEQFNISGANKLKDYIPKESKKSLEEMGIYSGNFDEISNLNLEKIIIGISKMIKKNINEPIESFLPIISVMILFIIVESIYPKNRNQEMSKILGCIVVLSICTFTLNPILKIIFSVSLVIKSASRFMLCYVPIMSTIMVASGQALSGASYHGLIICAGGVISHFSENFLIPILNSLLGFAVVSSLSPNLKLNLLCSAINKTIKKILEFISTIFTSIITLGHIVTTSGDSLTSSAAKSALGGCVPIIGSMISDAYGTVQGCLKLLKSGVGAFGIIVGAVIFIPILIKCGLWVIFLGFSKCLGDILELKKISSLLKAFEDIISILIAILIFSIVILIISSVVVLALGAK